MEIHISQRLVESHGITAHGFRRDDSVHCHAHAGIRPVSDHRTDIGSIEMIFPVEYRILISLQCQPESGFIIERSARRSKPAACDIFESSPVRSHHPAFGPHLYTHVADCHPAFHAHVAEDLASIFHETACTSVRPQSGNDMEYHVFRGDIGRQAAIYRDTGLLRF